MNHIEVRLFRRVILFLLFAASGISAAQCSSSITVEPTSTLPAKTAPSFPTATPSFTLTKAASPALNASISETPSLTNTPAASPSVTPTAALVASLTPTLVPTRAASPTLATPATPPMTARVPILMYHHIGALPPNPDLIRIDLTVAPETFKAEMQYLRDQGFHTIHLADLIEHFRTGAPLPPKPIILTFDDGYDDNYVNAFPVLREFGFSGTFFIITGFADSNAPGYLTWSQIEEMAANGMEIGSHSLDHRYNLATLSESRQRGEIQPSRDAVARHIPSVPPVFAYPSGSYNATTLRILSDLGYIAAVTTHQSTLQSAAAPYELRRVRVRGEWSPTDFVRWINYWLR